MKKSLNSLIHTFSQRDLDILYYIYNYRCLTENQICQLHFSKEKSFEHNLSSIKGRIQELCELDLIKKVEYLKGDEYVYFLTPFGIKAIRYFFELPTNIYDANKKVVKRGYYRASELKILPKNINHQVHLNQFVIDFQSLNLDITWKYFDEKHIGQYANIRPDGILSVLDTDFFLEMDMGTENQKQLQAKWENYRNFIASREYAYREKRITLLFIVANTAQIKERIDLVKYTIYERLLDVLDSEFEIYVGSSNNLLLLLERRLIPSCKGEDPYSAKIKKLLQEKHNFIVTEGEHLQDIFHGTKFTYYIHKVDENNKILIEDDRVQEFIVDDYFFEPASVISKIAYMDKNNSLFKHRFNRNISYLVIGKSEEQLYNDLKMMDLIGLKNIFFSTYRRLRTKPFHEALFQFDLLGNIHHFANNGLEERIFEEKDESIT